MASSSFSSFASSRAIVAREDGDADDDEEDAEARMTTTTARAGTSGTSRGAETYGETRVDGDRDALRDIVRAFEAVRRSTTTTTTTTTRG